MIKFNSLYFFINNQNSKFDFHISVICINNLPNNNFLSRRSYPYIRDTVYVIFFTKNDKV